MLKFEGIKEFEIEKLDKGANVSRDFQLIFRDDMLNEEECGIVEKSLNKHDFRIKDENVKIDIIYNIDLDIATISLTIYCPLMHLNQISEGKLSNFMDKHRTSFEEYYMHIKPY
ncbi:hypothetical protein [Methanobacterium sp.]|uniref:hypothetical protein n=1 Tax=Methanobacterium sp. TaxID=2164 RepID=UPI003C724A76